MTWLPDERVDYGYDALNRLTSATQASGANGFSQSAQYDEIGNLTSRSDVGEVHLPRLRPYQRAAACGEQHRRATTATPTTPTAIC